MSLRQIILLIGWDADSRPAAGPDGAKLALAPAEPAPLIVHYGNHEEKPLVFIRWFQNTSD
jgi:hypothetical protein